MCFVFLGNGIVDQLKNGKIRYEELAILFTLLEKKKFCFDKASGFRKRNCKIMRRRSRVDYKQGKEYLIME